MAYLPDYAWDLFVSYARADNSAFGGVRGWVSTLVGDLSGVIEACLGEPIKIFSDRDVHSNAELGDHLEAARTSATMLVIASPTYFKREGKLREWRAFTDMHQDLRRLIVVERIPPAEGSSYPAEIDKVWIEFWQRMPGQYDTVMPLTPGSEQYHARILELADRVQMQLRAIKGADAPAPPLPSVVPSKPRIFLSYSSKDRDRIQPLANRLEQAGHEVWWDPHIEMGTPFRKVIAAQLERAQLILVAWSRHSVDSDWVQEEAEVGKRKGCLRPVLIDPVDPPIGFRSYQTLDLSGWNGTGDDAIIVRLLEQLGRAPPTAS